VTTKFRGIASAFAVLAALVSIAAFASTSWAVEKAPKHTAPLPTITGSVVDGRLLSVTNGTWKGGTPTEYSYQWLRCGHGPCSVISGADEPTYRVQTADLGHKLRAAVTATNKAGSGKAKSMFTMFVRKGSPLNLVGPTISGKALVGETLTAEEGTWVGTPTITFSYQWVACEQLNGCKAIAGATGKTHAVGPTEAADGFIVEVKAENSVGSEKLQSPEVPAGGVEPPELP
jgi:hypothetical protein